MEKNGTLSKVLVIVGTVLVWFPILAPIVLGFISWVADGTYHLDYLMPAELGILVFVGGASLLWAAILVKSQRWIIAWGLGIAVGSIAILMAFGDVVPGSLEWAIVIGLLISYSLAIVVMGVGGVLLWRMLARK